MTAAATACPHRDIAHCPLYHAAHTGDGGGCDDGQLHTDQCAIARGLDYAQAVANLRITHPGLVERLEWNVENAARKQQRARNLRAAGLH